MFELCEIEEISKQINLSMLYEIAKKSAQVGNEILKIPFTDITRDINSLASIIKKCDLIISIDNSTAHLSASLGHPTWVLLPYSADFRWMEEITPAIWYQNTTLLRQEKENDWNSVVDLVCNAIDNSELNK